MQKWHAYITAFFFFPQYEHCSDIFDEIFESNIEIFPIFR